MTDIRTELWRFDLDSPRIRTLISYGGKLNEFDHFMPAASHKADEENFTILDVKGFRFDVKVNNTYAVEAMVTFIDNASSQEITSDASRIES